jgi:hypothetical protein
MRDQRESCEGVWMFHAANDVEKQLLMEASLKPECHDGLVAYICALWLSVKVALEVEKCRLEKCRIERCR